MVVLNDHKFGNFFTDPHPLEVPITRLSMGVSTQLWHHIVPE